VTLASRVGAAVADRLQDLAVLRDEDVERARGDAEAREQPGADHAGHLRQELVVRGAEHRAVKAEIRIDRGLALVRRLLHVGVRIGDRFDVRGGGALGRQRRGVRLDHAPQLEQLAEKLHARHCRVTPAKHVEIEQVPMGGFQHPSPRARARIHQAFGGERLQHLAHHRAARAQVPA